MAETIAIALLTAAGVAATGTALAVTTAIVSIGISVGVSLLAQQFLTPKTPSTPQSDRQFVNRAPASVRFRSYGRVRVSGAQMFLESFNGTLHRVIAHNDGLIDAVEEHLIDDTVVAIDLDGWVTTPRYVYNGTPKINIQVRLGEDSPPLYARLNAAFPEWDSNHLGRGIVSSSVELGPIKQTKFFEFYPSGENTSYKMTIRASRVWDPREPGQDPNDPATWVWSANSALVILDFLRHRTGFGMPLEWITPEIATWITAANVSGELVPNAASGTTPRYQIWGTYSYDERPADVLERMLASCNGKLWIGTSGGIQISVGAWVTPTVVIDDDAIISYQLGSGNEGPDSANTISAVYTEPQLGYIETDAAHWVNEANVAAFGEKKVDAKFYLIPNHSQCRRIQKQAAAKLAPAWKGVIRANLRALPALTERFVRIKISEMDLDITAEIEGVEFDVSDGSVVTGLTIEFSSIDAVAFEFDALTEEGVPSEIPPDIAGDGLQPPTNFNVAIQSRSSGGGSYAVAVATWDPYSFDGTTVQVEYAPTLTAEWALAPIAVDDVTMIETGPLTDGAVYDFRARTTGIVTTSEYSAIITRTVTVDTVAPDIPAALSTAKAGSTVTVSWTNPNSANTYGARVYRNTSNTPGSATLVTTKYAGASVAQSHPDASLPNGTYWWWVASINGSGVESARTLAGTQTIP